MDRGDGETATKVSALAEDMVVPLDLSFWSCFKDDAGEAVVVGLEGGSRSSQHRLMMRSRDDMDDLGRVTPIRSRILASTVYVDTRMSL